MTKYHHKKRYRAVQLLTHFSWLLVAAFFITGMTPQQAEAVNAKVAQYSKAPQAAKISVNLLALEKKAKTQAISFAAAAQKTAAKTAGGGVLLDIVVNTLDAAVLQKVNIPGVSILHSSVKYNRVSARVSNPALLHQLAKIPEVRSIRPEYGARTHVGIVTSRAAQAMKSDIASINFGLDGTGQRVGILSDSFACDDVAGNRDLNTLPAVGMAGTLTGSPSQDSLDIPAEVQILSDLSNPAASGCADEGAGMAELIHDVAPGASMAFASAFISEAAFAQGITDLCSTPVNSTVVVDDVSYFDEPMYQDGIVGQAAAACVASGVPYFSSAGNGANHGFRRVFMDINVIDDQAIPPTGNDLHNWGWGNGTIRDGFVAVTLQPNQSVRPVLQWNQPYDSLNPGVGSQIDLDLLITATPDVAGLAAPLASSFNIQGTTGAPAGDSFEFASYTNTTAAPITVYVAVDHFKGSQAFIPQNAATPVEFRIVFYGNASARQGITTGTSAFGGPTMYGHSVAPGVTSVAAVPWYETAQFNPNSPSGPWASPVTPVTDPESFTSMGGTYVTQFNNAGLFAPRTTFEPDISAPDGNNTRFFGFWPTWTVGFGEPDLFPNFFGTSASAPNAAAATLLMRQRNTVLTPLELNTALENSAVDVTGYRAAPGDDDVTGIGLIDSSAALALVPVGGVGGVVSAPQFTPPAGTYVGPQDVAISSTTVGASIRYTTNGIAPTPTTGTLYAAPITISATSTLKAIAFKSGSTPSTVTTGAYTISAPPPPLAPLCSNQVPPLAIPDNTPAGVSNSLVLANPGSLFDLNVSINASHTWIGDLAFTLTHVDTGTRATIFSPPTTCGAINMNATLDDEALAPATCVTGSPIAGAIRPTSPLAVFDGENLAGTWTLNVADFAAIDTGALNQWCLVPTVIAPVTPPSIGLALNGNVFNSTVNNTMNLTATTLAGSSPVNADVYVALQLPNGTLLVMQPGGSFSANLVPLVSNISVPNFSGNLFSYTFTGVGEPAGNYVWFAALTQPGTMNVIGTMAVVPFSYAP